MSAASNFQRMMNVATESLPFVKVYVDDVNLFSKSMGKFVGHSREVFQMPSDRELKIKLSNCHFSRSTITLLSHFTSSDGGRADDWKLATIKRCRTQLFRPNYVPLSA